MVAWNVRGFRTGPAAAAVAVAEESPDVALLNEVGRAGWRLRRFSSLVGMERAADVGLLRRGITNAILVRPPWRIVDDEVVRFSHRRGTIPRGMMTAVLGRSGFRLTAIAVHLGVSDRERLGHARELTDRLAAARQPVVLGGDLNEPPEGRAAAWIADRLWDAHVRVDAGPRATYPTVGPRTRIDYVFVSDGIRVERAWVKRDEHTEVASDHLPVFADLSLQPA